VNDEIRDITWSKTGQRNSVAVIDAVNASVGFTLPVEDMYMRRLREYKQQVLPIKYPTCPLGWEKHTSNPKKASDEGVAWITADGYFCGPPGSDPSTLYRESDPSYDSHSALNKRIRELTTEIKHTLKPGDYTEEIKKQKEKKEKHKTAFDKNKAAREASIKKENDAERKRNVEKLSKIIKDYGFQTSTNAKKEAETIFDQAKSCVEGNGSRFGCKRVTDNSDRSNPVKYYIPNAIYVAGSDIPDPMQNKLLEWWRSFRRAYANKKVLEERKNLAMYV